MLVQLSLRDIDEIDDAAGVAVLEYDPQLAVLEVGPVVFHDVFVVAQLQDLDFFLDCGQLGVGGGWQDLYGVEDSC
jgi:hypothetical protein